MTYIKNGQKVIHLILTIINRALSTKLCFYRGNGVQNDSIITDDPQQPVPYIDLTIPEAYIRSNDNKDNKHYDEQL